jgi:hypothetical protein
MLQVTKGKKQLMIINSRLPSINYLNN